MKQVLIFVLLFCSANLFGQDVITLKKGKVIKCKIDSLSIDNIYFSNKNESHIINFSLISSYVWNGIQNKDYNNLHRSKVNYTSYNNEIVKSYNNSDIIVGTSLLGLSGLYNIFQYDILPIKLEKSSYTDKNNIIRKAIGVAIIIPAVVELIVGTDKLYKEIKINKNKISFEPSENAVGIKVKF